MLKKKTKVAPPSLSRAVWEKERQSFHHHQLWLEADVGAGQDRRENPSENSQGSALSFWALAWATNHGTALADFGGEGSILIGLRFKRGRQEQMSWESFGI